MKEMNRIFYNFTCNKMFMINKKKLAFIDIYNKLPQKVS